MKALLCIIVLLLTLLGCSGCVQERIKDHSTIVETDYVYGRLVFYHINADDLEKSVSDANREIGPFLRSININDINIKLKIITHTVEIQAEPIEYYFNLPAEKSKRIEKWIVDTITKGPNEGKPHDPRCYVPN